MQSTKQLRTMASETVDPIDWPHPPPYTGHYPLSSTYCTVHCGLQITRHTALTEMRTCDLLNARPTHCLCGHSGYEREFLNSWCVLVCIAQRRSVAVLCMLYQIRCKPMHPLHDAPPYVPARVTRGARVAHRYTYAPPRCRILQYRRTFIHLSGSLWNDIADHVFDGEGLEG